jgi:N-formylglutamate deformylase
MALPILVSVPHAGLRVPPEVVSSCLLAPRQIVEDGDEHAAAIYDMAAQVTQYVTTDVARAVVDLNRAEDDRRPDGVVKTHTCQEAPIWRQPLDEAVIETLLAGCYRPYHARLRALAGRGVRLGADCHTMLAVGPPIGPGPGIERPHVCLGDADGACPPAWLACLARSFREQFGPRVTINEPFRGGHITRSHAAEMPWVQLELSRAPFATDAEKRRRVLHALQAALRRIDALA